MARPLRILTLSTLFPHAGAPNFGIFVERQTAQLARGADVTVISPVGQPPWPLSRSARYAAVAAVPLHETYNGLDVHRPRFMMLPKIGGPLNPAAIARVVIPLATRLHEAQPFDLIDAEFFYPDGPAAMRIAAKLGIPYTIKARGADIHHWGHAPGCAGQLLKAASPAAGLLAVSAALKADMIAMGIEESKITIHYTGLDAAMFQPRDRLAAKRELGIDGPLILSVGALIARKRHHLLIDALPAVPDATLILAGSGEAEAGLRRQADARGVANRVIFAGLVGHDALPALYAAADVMALPSASEGLANAWVEALACGTPIVICDVGGARELMTSPAAGAIVEPQPDAIANAIKAIVTNPPARETVRDTVASFSWQRNGEQLEAFFRDILAGHR